MDIGKEHPPIIVPAPVEPEQTPVEEPTPSAPTPERTPEKVPA